MRKSIRLGRPKVGFLESQALLKVMKSGQLTSGPQGDALERDWANLHGVQHAVAVSSGTAALELALRAVGVGPGDEVITPAFSWVATANAVTALGARAVFCDLEPHGFLMDINRIPALLTRKTKAVIIVHQFGEIVDISPIKEVLRKNGVSVVEDAACAVGAAVTAGIAGQIGDVAAFSLHPRKTVTCGEGGIVCTGDAKVAEFVTAFRNHGVLKTAKTGPSASRAVGLNDFSDFGMNYRLPETSASIARIQLRRLPKLLASRQKLAQLYQIALRDFFWLEPPQERKSEIVSNWQSFVITLKHDKQNLQTKLISFLRNRGVEASIGSVAIHLTPFYATPGLDSLANSERAYSRSVALPLHPGLRARHINFVVRQLTLFEREFLC